MNYYLKKKNHGGYQEKEKLEEFDRKVFENRKKKYEEFVKKVKEEQKRSRQKRRKKSL